MSEVVDFPGETVLPTPVPKVLARAAGSNLTDVVVLGWTKDGELYFASSSADGAEVLWVMEQAKHELMEMGRR